MVWGLKNQNSPLNKKYKLWFPATLSCWRSFKLEFSFVICFNYSDLDLSWFLLYIYAVLYSSIRNSRIIGECDKSTFVSTQRCKNGKFYLLKKKCSGVVLLNNRFWFPSHRMAVVSIRCLLPQPVAMVNIWSTAISNFFFLNPILFP